MLKKSSSVCLMQSPKYRKIGDSSYSSSSSLSLSCSGSFLISPVNPKKVTEIIESNEEDSYHPLSKDFRVQYKNRYSNVFPSKYGMITLENNGENFGDQYINADKIPAKSLFGIDTDYILTQGPLCNTWKDFWLMVYEQKSQLITMLCGMNKCSKYWPSISNEEKDKREFYYPTFTLKIVPKSEKFEDNMIVRKFTIEKYGETQIPPTDTFDVYQIQYLGWPDFGLPLCKLDKILSLFDELRGDSIPIVHCSAGLGRAGTFVACDIVKKLEQKGMSTRIPEIIESIRKYRIGAVQTDEQYQFVYKMLNKKETK